MKFASMICLTLSVVGCSETGTPRSPTVPTPPPVATPPQPTPPQSNLIAIWGYVVTPGGECIEGAIVEVVAGPTLGQKAAQKTPCNLTRYNGDGFMFDEGVPAGDWGDIRLRASAPGYVSREYNLSQWPWDVIATLTLVPTGP